MRPSDRLRTVTCRFLALWAVKDWTLEHTEPMEAAETMDAAETIVGAETMKGAETMEATVGATVAPEGAGAPGPF